MDKSSSNLAEEISPGIPQEGWVVLHLFCHLDSSVNGEVIVRAVKSAINDGYQVVSAGLIGHKADVGFVIIGPNLARLRQFQTELMSGGVNIVSSYLSITEVSEYAKNLPPERRNPRLYPQLPPSGKRAFCFYPMSKRRNVDANWFTLEYDVREGLMAEHGTSGRKFSGRVLQLITGSTGLDEFEWGVTLFAQRIDDIKDVVYTLRFDEASAIYAEFGPFYVGIIDDVDSVLAACMPGTD